MKHFLMIMSAGTFMCQAAAAQEQPATAFTPYEQQIPGTDLKFKMVPIQGGSFLMGSPAGEQGRGTDEGPQQQVKISPFWMGACEVTFDEYDIYADAEKDKTPTPDGMTRPSPPYIDLTLGMGKSGGYPANSMSQYGALMYCRWLYAKTGIFFRLPTEAEWEYACRAGSTTAYPFGKDAGVLKDYAWYAGDSENKYHKVGQLKPNAWGLYDMLGNVGEWTMDQYDEHFLEKAGKENPWNKPTAKTSRTIKGGNYQDTADKLRSAARLKSDPNWNRRDPQIPKSKWWNADAPFIGFRVVRPQQQPTPAEAAEFYETMIDKYIGAR
ncbi:formylglycine-generating enzyme family protein [Chitinophaga pendula]|uniref:formylglycine-generating enzyme family protein n=1 Tax=Chitinophaga TaxID=79328 RepID=UPI000BAF1DA8|nr:MULTISPECIES: formylglycine-generating enzyme family protein [Chitinophaga]ASZ10416.1 sulfatase-modifying factor [Chitinophaga sp. MD30]UCJ06616.1 formylglycine-generating enzyme family protein [Chitinophaga pendula]